MLTNVELGHFAYIKTKAEWYRQRVKNEIDNTDSLGNPLFTEEEKERIMIMDDGCRQLLEDYGQTPEKPLENLGTTVFYRLLNKFDLTLKIQAICKNIDGYFIDEMTMFHPIHKWEIKLYNKVKKTMTLRL